MPKFFFYSENENNKFKRVAPELTRVSTTSNDLLKQTFQDMTLTPHYLLFLDNSYIDVVQHTAFKEQRREPSSSCATCA